MSGCSSSRRSGRALAGGHDVVTHETVSDGRRKIKIPNAAIAHGVQPISPFQMLRAMGARFVLEAQTRQLSFSSLRLLLGFGLLGSAGSG
ncbi:DUF4411 family protein [Candidatus Poriferisodalis sp.]|uniref:DUF4411 family protein n=1 Tax=Candidatus Poriferisodalis sp. TaxID=3101277 RepID=UPI003C6EEB42